MPGIIKEAGLAEVVVELVQCGAVRLGWLVICADSYARLIAFGVFVTIYLSYLSLKLPP